MARREKSRGAEVWQRTWEKVQALSEAATAEAGEMVSMAVVYETALARLQEQVDQQTVSVEDFLRTKYTCVPRHRKKHEEPVYQF